MPQEIRIYTQHDLDDASRLRLLEKQAHYLANVMRCKVGDKVSLFNGRDGQWEAEINSVEKRSIEVVAIRKTRPQTFSPDLWLVFAPIKNKTELVVEKATELGVAKIIPIVTKHCVVRSVNIEKLAVHAVEAAEQCERLDIPALETFKDLSYLLGEWHKDNILLYGDETGGGVSLSKVLDSIDKDSNSKLAVLVGPEGGFSGDELNMLRKCDFARPFGMGGRILRADTAVVAALACVQSRFGDWDVKPHFKVFDKE